MYYIALPNIRSLKRSNAITYWQIKSGNLRILGTTLRKCNCSLTPFTLVLSLSMAYTSASSTLMTLRRGSRYLNVVKCSPIKASSSDVRPKSSLQQPAAYLRGGGEREGEGNGEGNGEGRGEGQWDKNCSCITCGANT